MGGLILAMNAKATDSGICAKQMVMPSKTSRMTYSVEMPSIILPNMVDLREDWKTKVGGSKNFVFPESFQNWWTNWLKVPVPFPLQKKTKNSSCIFPSFLPGHFLEHAPPREPKAWDIKIGTNTDQPGSKHVSTQQTEAETEIAQGLIKGLFRFLGMIIRMTRKNTVLSSTVFELRSPSLCSSSPHGDRKKQSFDVWFVLLEKTQFLSSQISDGTYNYKSLGLFQT